MKETENAMTGGLPLLAVLATGGTIAGTSAADGYTPGMLSAEALLAAVPDLRRHALLRCEQLANIGSEDMTEAVWLALARRVRELAAEPEVRGIVVLHGTDTMEETAYFLDLAVATGKPIVFTGSMRPADAVGADGPANLLAAVRTAAAPEAAGRGVLVLFNDRLFAAREVVKLERLNTDAFAAPGAGPLGEIVNGAPLFRQRFTAGGREFFPIPAELLRGELPRVEIMYGHAGQRSDLIEAVLALPGLRGVVCAAVGMGNVHAEAKPALRRAALDRGIAVVWSSRVPYGWTPYRPGVAESEGAIFSGRLNPQKARVLLQLGLLQTNDRGDLQRIFDKE